MTFLHVSSVNQECYYWQSIKGFRKRWTLCNISVNSKKNLWWNMKYLKKKKKKIFIFTIAFYLKDNAMSLLPPDFLQRHLKSERSGENRQEQTCVQSVQLEQSRRPSKYFLKDFLKTFWRRSDNFLRTFWGLSDSFLRTSENFHMTFKGLSKDFSRTFTGLLKTFWGLS